MGDRQVDAGAAPSSGDSTASASPASRTGNGAGSPSGSSPTTLTKGNQSKASGSNGRRGGNQAKPAGKGDKVTTIGATIRFTGDLTGEEDLEILGEVDGKVELPNHQLTIGDGGRVTAEVSAKVVLVQGKITGNVTATERLEIQSSGVIEGDIRAPRLLVQEGAVVNGSVEMSATAASASTKSSPTLAPPEETSGRIAS